MKMPEPVFIERKKSILFGALLLMLISFYVRAVNLGQPSFNIDELNHVFAAKSCLENGEPLLPSGLAYDRALPVTRLVAFSFRVFGVSEWTARLPSLIFGMLDVLLFFLLCSIWFRPAVGFIAALLMALAPEQILVARFTRMYAPLQFFYLLGVFLFSGFLEWKGRFRSAVLCGVSLLALAASVKLQILSADFFPSLYAYLLAVLFAWWLNREHKCLEKPALHFILLALMSVGGLLVVIVRPDLPGEFWKASQSVLAWSEESARNPLYYWNRLGEKYGLFTVLLPFSMLAMMLRYSNRGFYFVMQFCVPFFLHSFVFANKSERYILHFLPFFFLMTAVLMWEMGNYLHYLLMKRGRSLLPNTGFRKVSAGILVLVLFLYVISRDRWLEEGVSLHKKKEGIIEQLAFDDWRKAGTYVRERASDGALIVSSSSLAALQYVGRVDYNMNEGDKDILYVFANEYPAHLQTASGEIKEFYGGRSYLETVEALEQVASRTSEIWFISDRSRYKPVAEEVLAYLRKNFKEHPVSETMYVFSKKTKSVAL